MPAYLVTKAIASGMFMIMAAIWLLGLSAFDRRTALVGNGIALVFLAITTVLLVADLERPERFLRILTRPQWKSWLTRGAFILIGFSLVCTAWFAVELGAQLGWVPEGVAEAARIPLMLLGFPLALLTAIYTAFLFQQCEGRDLWQSRLMPWHMGVQAVMAGGGVWLLWLSFGSRLLEIEVVVLLPLSTLALDMFLRSVEEKRHRSRPEGQHLAIVTQRNSAGWLWRRSRTLSRSALVLMAVLILGFIAHLQAIIPVARLGVSTPDGGVQPEIVYRWKVEAALWSLYPWVPNLAASLALIGLFLYESAIIKAGRQDVPNA